MDAAIPSPRPTADLPFLMQVEVVTRTGRGTIVAGRVLDGSLKPPAEVEIFGIGSRTVRASVTAVDMYGRTVPEARAGHVVGLLLHDVDVGEVEPGMLAAAAGTVGR